MKKYELTNETHGDSKQAKAYLLAADLAEVQIDLSDNGEGEA